MESEALNVRAPNLDDRLAGYSVSPYIPSSDFFVKFVVLYIDILVSINVIVASLNGNEISLHQGTIQASGYGVTVTTCIRKCFKAYRVSHLSTMFPFPKYDTLLAHDLKSRHTSESSVVSSGLHIPSNLASIGLCRGRHEAIPAAPYWRKETTHTRLIPTSRLGGVLICDITGSLTWSLRHLSESYGALATAANGILRRPTT